MVFYLFAIAQGTQFTQNYEFFIKIESNLTIIKIVHLIMNNQRLVAEQERRFRRACEQIAQLDYKLHYTQKKYNKAKQDRRLALRYSYLLQIVAVESFGELFYMYAEKKAGIIKDMEGQME